MNRMTVRARFTLWLSAALILGVVLTSAIVLTVTDAVLREEIRDDLTAAVDYNVTEIEYRAGGTESGGDNDDRLIPWNGGVLEIDDDFRVPVNNVAAALYQEDGTLLYGTDPLGQTGRDLPFSDRHARRVTAAGVQYCVYDRQPGGEGLEGLWVRGVVSEEREMAEMSSAVRRSLLLLPFLLGAAIFGGYLMAGQLLRPLGEMSETAAAITRGLDLTKRIDIGPGEDELHRLAGSFNTMMDRVEDALESERQFTADVSHELRTPLSVIQAQCELALEEPQTGEDYAEALTVIRRQGDKMSALISDMLDSARLERRSEPFPKAAVDLSALVGSVCGDMALVARKGIALHWTAEEGVSVLGSRELLARLLTNLIDNAYRYGRENGRIDVSLTRTAGQICLTVADDGVGIAPEDLDRIFRRFYQADPSHAAGGSGLGLAMVRQIARCHDGEVTAESEPGRGSRFRFTMEALT